MRNRSALAIRGLAAVILLAATPGLAEPLRIGVTDFPPWFVPQDGKMVGIVPDTLNALFGDLEVDVTLELRPIARLKSEVLSGSLDCRAAAWEPPDDATYDTTREPLFRVAYGAFVRSGDDRIIAAGPSELRAKGVRWGLVHGLEYTDELMTKLEEGTILRSWENRDNLLHLIEGRIDVAIGEPLTFAHLAASEGQAEAITLLQPALIHKDYYLACMRSAKARAALARFDDALQALREGPNWAEILGRYLSPTQRDLYQQLSSGMVRRPASSRPSQTLATPGHPPR